MAFAPQKFDLKNERHRLSTFAHWPVSHIASPKSLAASGFYYVKHEDKVVCTYCQVLLCKWKPGDIVIDNHEKYSPHCPFILDQNVGNVPIIEGIQLKDLVENQNETGESIEFGSNQNLSVRSPQITIHRMFNSYISRLCTYKGWTNKLVTPEVLATAGFFFSGFADKVHCFYCNGSIQNWKVNYNPWIEHARWFPKCSFLDLDNSEIHLDARSMEEFKALLNRSRFEDTSQKGCTLVQPATRRIRDTDIYSQFIKAPPAVLAFEMGFSQSVIIRAIKRTIEKYSVIFRLTNRCEHFLTEVVNQLNNTVYEASAGNLYDEFYDSYEPETNFYMGHEGPHQRQNGNGETPDANKSAQSSQANDNNIAEIENAVSLLNVNPSTSDLEEENRRLKEASLCKICLDEKSNIVLLPCAHLIACDSCASKIQNCPLCHQSIKATINIYIS